MISPLEYKVLKGMLQGNYTKAVLLLLKKQGVVQKNGKPYSARYIRAVLQGKREHALIESTLRRLAVLREKK